MKYKIVDPVAFVKTMDSGVGLIEIDVTYKDGFSQSTYYTLDDYKEFVLITKFEDMGYDMTLIKDYGQLKYQQGSDSGWDSGYEFGSDMGV